MICKLYIAVSSSFSLCANLVVINDLRLPVSKSILHVSLLWFFVLMACRRIVSSVCWCQIHCSLVWSPIVGIWSVSFFSLISPILLQMVLWCLQVQLKPLFLLANSLAICLALFSSFNIFFLAAVSVTGLHLSE